tara:strand:+ start:2363 stop:2683 length:321 start_codon:yes stop_codon:yes gene_type:complete
MSSRGGRGGGRVMEEGYYLDKNPDKTSEDYSEMLLYHGGRGGDIGGGNFVVEEDGVPRNYAGEVKPGWKPARGKGQVAADGSAPKSGSLRRKVHAQRKSLITSSTV